MMSDDIEVLLIRVGRREFALPMEEVLYIARLPADFRHTGADADEFFAFEGTPLEFISSWQALGETSLYQEFVELETMLPQRRQDHLDWVAALEDALVRDLPFTRARSARECAFGQWYHGYQPSDRRLSVLLASFENPHNHIHALADRLLGMARQGERERALILLDEEKRSTLKTLLDLFDRAAALMKDLQRRIVIVVTDRGVRHALGADTVSDIVPVAAAHVTWEHRHGRQRPKLVIFDDKRIVPVLCWRDWLQARTPPTAMEQDRAAA